MRFVAAGVLALAPALSGSAALACGESLGAGARQLGDAQVQLAYKTRPEVPVVGSHFTIDIALCPRGSARAPAALSVDAHMPAHRHGMNYQASVSPRGPGLYRAEGLMFHMPGRWELVFELRSGSGTVQRLTQTLMID